MGNFKNYLKLHHFFIFCCFVVGLALRWWDVGNSMSFFYDQGRDATRAAEILSGNLTLIGPATDAAGVYMGPLWFYLLAILYWLFSGNPENVLKFLTFLDMIAIWVLYLIGRRVFSLKIALLSVFIWSFGAWPVAYARTLSNPASSSLWTLLIIYAFLKFKDAQKQKWIYIIILCSSILLQLNPASAIILAPSVLICLWIFRKKIRITTWLMCVTIVLLFLSPQIIFELKHKLISATPFMTMVGGSGPKEGYFYGVVQRYLNFRLAISSYFLPGWGTLTVLIFSPAIFLLYFQKKYEGRKLIILFIIGQIIAGVFFYTRGESHPHYFYSLVVLGVFIFAYAITVCLRLNKVLALAIIILYIYTNILGLRREIVFRDHLAQPADPTFIGLGDQIKIIDFLYSDAKSQNFGYQIYSLLPYWDDEHWQYLFNWYGNQTYGYIPLRHQGDPIYLIYPHDPFLPEYQAKWLKNFREHGKGNLIFRKSFGPMTIEKFQK